MLELLSLLLAVVPRALRSRHDLLLENLFLRQQLQVALRSQRRPALRTWDKLFWVSIHSFRWDWRRHLLLVRPEAVIRWRRQGWRLYWRWRSSTRLGRPRLTPEVRELITTMADQNPLWGTERIRGELLKLGFVVSARSIRRYRRRPRTRPPSQSWRTFLINHASAIWAADLFVVQTLGFKTLYVLFFISHDRRELLHFRVTSQPAAAWTWRQTIEATAWGRLPRFLIHDRDRVWGGDFAARLAAIGINSVTTPIRAPNANSIGERVVGSLRRECLDHMIILGERHLSTVLAEFVAYYNHDRPHRTLGLETPISSVRSLSGEVRSRPILGGLHHAYERAA